MYILADQPIYLILRLLHWHHQGLLHNSILFCCEMGSLGQIWQINSILDWNRVGGGYLVYPLIIGKLIWFCLDSMVKETFLTRTRPEPIPNQTQTWPKLNSNPKWTQPIEKKSDELAQYYQKQILVGCNKFCWTIRICSGLSIFVNTTVLKLAIFANALSWNLRMRLVKLNKCFLSQQICKKWLQMFFSKSIWYFCTFQWENPT